MAPYPRSMLGSRASSGTPVHAARRARSPSSACSAWPAAPAAPTTPAGRSPSRLSPRRPPRRPRPRPPATASAQEQPAPDEAAAAEGREHPDRRARRSPASSWTGWAYALSTNDASAVTSLSARGKTCEGCADLTQGARDAQEGGLVRRLPGRRGRPAQGRGRCPAPRACGPRRAKVDIPASRSYFEDGTFRNDNAAHENTPVHGHDAAGRQALRAACPTRSADRSPRPGRLGFRRAHSCAADAACRRRRPRPPRRG